MTPVAETLTAGAWLRDLHERAQTWAAEQGGTPNQTPAYIDLLFAFGLARLKQATDAHTLLNQAGAVLLPLGEAHACLFDAFEYRIRQALREQPHAGPLPPEQMERLENIDRLERYAVDRLRKHSRVL